MSHRARYIKPEFWSDEKIGRISREARLFFIGLWGLADKYGVVEYRPMQIKVKLFPYDDDISASKIDSLTDEVLKEDLCRTCEVLGKSYLFIKGLIKHQKLTTWEADKSKPVLNLQVLDGEFPDLCLRQYFRSASKALGTKNREERIENRTPYPQGAREGGRFESMLGVIVASGKAAASLSEDALAIYWRNVNPALAPDDPAWLEYLRVALDGCVGKIGSMLHWLPRNANQFAESIVGVVSTELAALGPSAGDL